LPKQTRTPAFAARPAKHSRLSLQHCRPNTSGTPTSLFVFRKSSKLRRIDGAAGQPSVAARRRRIHSLSRRRVQGQSLDSPRLHISLPNRDPAFRLRSPTGDDRDARYGKHSSRIANSLNSSE
jgi:hypothetical protein